jgi:FkbM family methyltransferase
LFLDIGANLGYYSLLFASIGYDVLAVEAMPNNAQAIRCSLCLNPSFTDRVTLVNTALGSEKDKDLICAVSGDGLSNKGNGRLRCTPDEPTSSASLVVPLTTLDEVLSSQDTTSVDVVKMDVEGFECNIMAGGSSLFSHYRPKFVQFEAKGAKTTKCMEAAADKQNFGHRLGVRRGHDNNIVMART